MAVSNSVNLLYNSTCHKFKIIENAEDNQDVIYLKHSPNEHRYTSAIPDRQSATLFLTQCLEPFL